MACAKRGLNNTSRRENRKTDRGLTAKRRDVVLEGNGRQKRPRSEFHELCMHTRLVSKEESTEQGGESTMTDD